MDTNSKDEIQELSAFVWIPIISIFLLADKYFGQLMDESGVVIGSITEKVVGFLGYLFGNTQYQSSSVVDFIFSLNAIVVLPLFFALSHSVNKQSDVKRQDWYKRNWYLFFAIGFLMLSFFWPLATLLLIATLLTHSLNVFNRGGRWGIYVLMSMLILGGIEGLSDSVVYISSIISLVFIIRGLHRD